MCHSYGFADDQLHGFGKYTYYSELGHGEEVWYCTIQYGMVTAWVAE
jgi:hypothetical protein